MTNKMLRKHFLYVVVIFVTILYVMFLFSCRQLEESDIYNSKNLYLLDNVNFTNIKFINKINEDEKSNILEYDYFYNGGGVCLADFNKDNLLDVFLTGNQVDNKLFFNDGDLKFKESPEIFSENGRFWSTGAVPVDINEDGWLDIYVCNSGPNLKEGQRRNQLFINNGGKNFSEESKKYGIDDDGGSTMASFFDYDKDGDLDLFVLNHCEYQKFTITDFAKLEKVLEDKVETNYGPIYNQSCHLYENDAGTYRDVTEKAGVLKVSFGLGLITKDFNNDGWTDIYVANDYHIPDKLYINKKDGTFSDEIKMRTRHIPFYSMGCDFEDINQDGDPDLMTLDMAPVGHFRSKTMMPSMSSSLFNHLIFERGFHYQYMFNCLQLNNGNGTFKDIAQFAGLAKSEWSWSTLIHDFDLDGQNDVFISNGFKRDTKNNDWRLKLAEMDKQGLSITEKFEYLQEAPSEKTENYIFRNLGDLKFENVNKEWNLEDKYFSNGAIYGDLDSDGDSELIINNIDENVALYKNNAIEKNTDVNFLKIELVKGNNNYPVEAINSKIKIYKNDKIWFKEVHPVSGYQSSLLGQYTVFGLGEVTEVDSIEVVWNTVKTAKQKVSKLGKTNSNQLITLDLNKAKSILNKDLDKNKRPLFANVRSEQFNLGFVHKEDKFNDFEEEVLLPHRMSQLGPFLSKGDVNSDGQIDFFISGAKGQSSELFAQNNGIFYKTQGLPWQDQVDYEDMGSLFFDSDNDGDQDLYIVSGGSVKGEEKNLLQDRLFLNMGSGFVEATEERLPKIESSGSKVIGSDFDKDGDIDLFVCGRHLLGKYPQSPKSYLLVNEKGYFSDKTIEIGSELLQKAGMITDAIWMDYDEDQDDDLLVLGEWTGFKIYQNEGGKLNLIENEFSDLNGWWQSITKADFDGDGDLDLLLGNMGENSKFKVSKEKPLHINAADFDDNGTNDIVLSTYSENKQVPVRGRECSSEQMPFLSEKFPTFESFALAEITEILPKEKMKTSVQLSINTLKSYFLENKGRGNFVKHALPNIAQLAAINAAIPIDVNKDGLMDVLIAGNLYETEVETPRYDSGIGQVLINQGDFAFHPLSINETGLYLPMDVKDVCLVPNTNGFNLIIANNNNYLQCYKSLY